MRGLKRLHAADTVTRGHALVQNLRNGFSSLTAGVPRQLPPAPPRRRVAGAAPRDLGHYGGFRPPAAAGGEHVTTNTARPIPTFAQQNLRQTCLVGAIGVLQILTAIGAVRHFSLRSVRLYLWASEEQYGQTGTVSCG